MYQRCQQGCPVKDALERKMTITRRLLQALALNGHPNIKPLPCWATLIFLAILYSYLLSPLLTYYVRGVPTKEKLEILDGTWRQEGEVRSGKNRILPPLYFIDGEFGSRQMHCGFKLQQALCGFPYGPSLQTGDKVRLYYDRSFGILAYYFPDHPVKSGMDYQTGVYTYARPERLLLHNGKAHALLPLLILAYALLAFLCWQELKEKNFS